MSLCYDFQKWAIISLAAFAISLSVGIALQVVHGQNQNITNYNIKWVLSPKNIEQVLTIILVHVV